MVPPLPRIGLTLRHRYHTVDVFTDRPLSGNPVAVVLDGAGLSDAAMQRLAAEFNWSETTVVLPPADPVHAARVRIFTPDREIPFAGHPNLGTAFVLAREAARHGDPVPDRLVFEEQAGLVHVELRRAPDGSPCGAELLTPEPLSRRALPDPAAAAACLGLHPDDLRRTVHPPQVISVGLPFLVVELATCDALRRARPDRGAHDALFPLDGARSVYAYCRAPDPSAGGIDLEARMFTARLTEDPATGSATAALAALLADDGDPTSAWHVRQGADMGRPSLLHVRAVRTGTGIRAVVGGDCAPMFDGTFETPEP